MESIEKKFGRRLLDAEDIQALRSEVENVKINLTSNHKTNVRLKLTSFFDDASINAEGCIFEMEVSKNTFEELNKDLFEKILEPIQLVLEAAELTISEVDEIVMVGGSTRIPKVREKVSAFFSGKNPNVAIDPELAVVTGVSIQAGILGGAWPLTVSAVEAMTSVKKLYVK